MTRLPHDLHHKKVLDPGFQESRLKYSFCPDFENTFTSRVLSWKKLFLVFHDSDIVVHVHVLNIVWSLMAQKVLTEASCHQTTQN